MSRLSPTMVSCLRWLQAHGADERWIRVSSSEYSAATLKALKRRGFLEITYRLEKFDPNVVAITLHQALTENAGAVWRDPWVKLTSDGAERAARRTLTFRISEDRIRIKALCARDDLLSLLDQAKFSIIEIEDALERGTKHFAKDGTPLLTVSDIIEVLQRDGEIVFEPGNN